MGNSLEQALKRCDFGGACAPPFCAVGRLSAPFNASLACWKLLSIRRREVFKGFGGANMTPIRRTGNQKPAEIQRVLCVNIGTERILKPLLVFCIKATAIINGLLSFLLGYIMKVTGSTYHTSTGLPL